MPKALVVDDEPKLLKVVGDFLRKEGFSVVGAASGEEALDAFAAGEPDVVILDWMLPGISGIDVCRRLREKSSVPIIMLTARADEIDKLLGLELGADDYLTKPFSLRELLARIRAVLRRASPRPREETGIVIGDLAVYPQQHLVTLRGKPVEVTPTEFRILLALAQNPGRVFSRLQLLDAALGEQYEGYERAIDTHLYNLRRKIEDDPASPRYIRTVYGIGYKMTGRGADR